MYPSTRFLCVDVMIRRIYNPNALPMYKEDMFSRPTSKRKKDTVAQKVSLPEKPHMGMHIIMFYHDSYLFCNLSFDAYIKVVLVKLDA
jgi:hypothetical protein